MSIAITPYVRNTLLLDGLVSGAAGVVMAAGASLLSPWLALPADLLFWAGIVLLPWCAALVILARRAAISRMMMLDVIGINALWVAASFGIMIAGIVQPSLLGVLFITAQALTVGLFVALQIGAMRRAGAAA